MGNYYSVDRIIFLFLLSQSNKIVEMLIWAFVSLELLLYMRNTQIKNILDGESSNDVHFSVSINFNFWNMLSYTKFNAISYLEFNWFDDYHRGTWYMSL